MPNQQKIYIDPMNLAPPGASYADQKLEPEISRGETEHQSIIKEAHEDALREAYKDNIREQRKHRKKLNDLIDKSQNVLVRIRNIIPIFTDEIVIDSNKVTIINRPFFFSEHIQSISIKNINDVFIETIPFLATINIMDAGLPRSSIIKIKWFWKKNAEKARRVITGLMEASKEDVDLKSLAGDTLRDKLEEIGRLREASTTVSKD